VLRMYWTCRSHLQSLISLFWGWILILNSMAKGGRGEQRLGARRRGAVLLFQQPLVFLGIVEFPGAHGAGHDVEVVEVVAVDGGAGVVAFWDHGDVAVFDGHRFVELAIVGVDALKGEALGWVEAVVIGFLKLGFVGQVVLVVLVAGIGRGAAVGGDDFNNEQAFGALVLLGQNVADITRVGARASGFNREFIGRNHKSSAASLGGGGANVDDAIGCGCDRPFGFGWNVDVPGLALEHRHAVTYDTKAFAIDFDVTLAGDEDDAGLAFVFHALGDLAGR
jgi:hypothetical protein